MPYLRFTRDRRGYENTYLVENVRRRGREQARVLYWFRSPPQVKVGRAAIDEEAIRALEDAYPDIPFDWTRILEARPPDPEPPAEDPRRRGRARVPREREPRREGRPEPPPGPREERPAQPAPVPGPSAASDLAPEPPQEQVRLPARLPVELVEEAPGPVAEGFEPPPEPAPEPDTDEEPAAPAHATEPSAAARILGSEGLLRLRARYAEVCARITAQVAEPARQETVRALAERLNPDAWVTDADVQSGLEQFEQVLDQVRREVGPLRRRTRRGGRRNRKRRDASPGETTTVTADAVEPADHDTSTDDGGSDDEA